MLNLFKRLTIPKKKDSDSFFIGSLIIGFISYFFFNDLYKSTLISGKVDQVRKLILSAGAVCTYTSEQHSTGIFKQVMTELNKVLLTVPIFAAMKTVRSKAKEGGTVVNQTIEVMSNVTHESATGVQQIARSAEDLSRLTVNLQELTAQFKVDESAGKMKSRLAVRANCVIVRS